MLTKSKYIQGIQCKKALWLRHHSPILFKSNDVQQAAYEQGVEVGIIARRLFGDAVLIDPKLPFQNKIEITKDFINQFKSIFEGAFIWNGCFCLVDVLLFRDGEWHLVEVKSSTSVKSIHFHDVAFQYFILTQLGISIDRVFICHINSLYKRESIIDYSLLFNMTDVTSDVMGLIPSVKKNIYDFKITLSLADIELPIGPHCCSPYNCPAMSLCWTDVPKNSIFNLAGLSSEKKFSFYYEGRYYLSDFVNEYGLSLFQQRQIACFLEDLDFIDINSLRLFLSQFKYPLSFLDFECVQYPIPPFKNMVPYEQLPIQFSLHIYTLARHISHVSFLSPHGHDPRHLFLTTLIEKLPTSGSIVVFNKSSEALVLKHLKAYFPEYSIAIDNIISRMIDIHVPFKNQMIMMRAMNGKTSIKSILPSLCPTASFDQLPISSGGSINHIYNQLGDSIDNESIIEELKLYSHMDTYAMVLIFKQLQKLSAF